MNNFNSRDQRRQFDEMRFRRNRGMFLRNVVRTVPVSNAFNGNGYGPVFSRRNPFRGNNNQINGNMNMGLRRVRQIPTRRTVYIVQNPGNLNNSQGRTTRIRLGGRRRNNQVVFRKVI